MSVPSSNSSLAVAPVLLRLVSLLIALLGSTVTLVLRLLLRVCAAAVRLLLAECARLVGPLRSAALREVRLATVGGLLEPIRALLLRVRARCLLIVLRRRVLRRRRLLLHEGDIVPADGTGGIGDRGVLLLVLRRAA